MSGGAPCSGAFLLLVFDEDGGGVRMISLWHDSCSGNGGGKGVRGAREDGREVGRNPLGYFRFSLALGTVHTCSWMRTG